MIPAKRLKELCGCFPKAQVSNPNFYSSFFFDEDGKAIGWLSYRTGEFIIDERYEHFELVKKILIKNNVEHNSEPADLAELVYGNLKDE